MSSVLKNFSYVGELDTIIVTDVEIILDIDGLDSIQIQDRLNPATIALLENKCSENFLKKNLEKCLKNDFVPKSWEIRTIMEMIGISKVEFAWCLSVDKSKLNHFLSGKEKMSNPTAFRMLDLLTAELLKPGLTKKLTSIIFDGKMKLKDPVLHF